MTPQPVVELTGSPYTAFGYFLAFVLMLMAGTVLNGFLRDRGFGVVGNGFFVFVGIALGVLAMGGFQTYF